MRAHELLKNSKLKPQVLIRYLSGDACCTQHHTLVVVYRSLKPKPQHGLDLLLRLRIYALLNVRKNGPFRRHLIGAKVNCPQSQGVSLGRQRNAKNEKGRNANPQNPCDFYKVHVEKLR